jgi:rare lipoprotein A
VPISRILPTLSLLAVMPVLCADSTLTASWYGSREEGRTTASGCAFHAAALTAAHRILPLGTVLEVRRGGRAVEVTVNDRGPYVRGRQLDLSRGAAERLGMINVGVTQVRARVVGYRVLQCR